MIRKLALSLLLISVSLPLKAQHSLATNGSYDPAIPRPHTVLGYEVGDRFTPHHMLMRYLDRLAEASPLVRIDTIAHTFEGRELPLVVMTSAANHARMDQVRADARRIANPVGVPAGELRAAESRMPAIVWLGYTVHGNEASGLEAAIALLYQLAAGRDADTRMILDSTVVLIQPLQNPDGHERHVQDVMRARGAFGVNPTPGSLVHSGNWPGPRTSHYYFDLNRDWFALSHPETRGRIAAFLDWWPHVAADLHEMGSNSTYFFPPPMDPVNRNVHQTVIKWWDIFGNANSAAFDELGLPYFRREGYDAFYAGFGDSWPVFNGAIGMTYEQASSAGGAIRRSDGSVLTLRDASFGHYTASWATLMASASRARERVRDYAEFRRTAISDSERAASRYIIMERDIHGRADSLVSLLQRNGIAVQRLRGATDVAGAVPYGSTSPRSLRAAAGTYVVDLAQPQGRLARALLEPEAQLDSSFIAEELDRRRTGRGNRFYDLTAWSLPFMYNVNAYESRTLGGALEPVELQRSAPALPQNARYAYAFEVGSEASYSMLGKLFGDSVRMRYSPRAFRAGDADFPRGAVIIPVVPNGPEIHERVRSHAASSGAEVIALQSAAVSAGADLGSNSVFNLRQPRVALVGGDPVSGQAFGYTWYAFDQRLRFPVTNLSVSAVGGAALDEFNVLVVPSVSAGGINSALGEGGRERLAAWVRAGGVLITLDGASSWLASEQLGLSRFRPGRDTARAETPGMAPLSMSVPGAIVRAVADTLSPLMAGMTDREFPVLLFSDRIYAPPSGLRPGEVVVRYAPSSQLRLAGYMWPEVPNRVGGTPWLWTERVGRGRVIAFAGDPNFRDMYRGLLPLFANAVFFGGSF